MNVPRPSPTDDIEDTLKDGIGQFIEQTDPLRHILTGAEGAGDREAMQVYRVTLVDAAHFKWQNRKFTGWRFMAVDQTRRGVVVNVSAAGDGQPSRVATVRNSLGVASAIETVRNVPVPPNVSPDDVELCIITLPGLVEMLWIRPKSGGDGWVIPYNTLIAELRKEQSYTFDDFFIRAQPYALRRYEADEKDSHPTMTSF